MAPFSDYAINVYGWAVLYRWKAHDGQMFDSVVGPFATNRRVVRASIATRRKYLDEGETMRPVKVSGELSAEVSR